MLGYVYGKGQALSANQDLGVKVATPVGTFIGQLLFGWLADLVGRKRMCMSFQLLYYINYANLFATQRRYRVDDHHYWMLRPIARWTGARR